ncbi:MAG TPA: PepSY domain-containing protein [Pyrinomonadaceae bacterium]|nr:PepSY domain-containing protein [Pyrinomonadaceae bacterium]
MKYYLMLVAVMASVLSLGMLVTASAQSNGQSNKESQTQARLARQAKITMEQAQEVALRRAPGNVESSELERERGKVVYSFDIRNSRGTITEIQVSAITGRVVRVEQENKKQEAAEKRKEQKEKSGNNRQP